MKLKTWENLKVGDKVTVRTIKEMKSLQGTCIDRNGDLLIKDSKTGANTFVIYGANTMSHFCGNTYVISWKNQKSLRLEGDARGMYFKRKMLRNEVIKNEADSNL